MKRDMKKMAESGRMYLDLIRDLSSSEVKELLELNSKDMFCALSTAFYFGVEVGRRQERKKTK